MLNLDAMLNPFGASSGPPRDPKNTLPPRREANFALFALFDLRPFWGPSWGPFRGPLGGAFWLTSRLKIGQDPPRPLLDYFFSAPRPSPGPFGGPSSPFPGPLSRDWPKISPREAPRDPQMPPRGVAKLARKKPRETKIISQMSPEKPHRQNQKIKKVYPQALGL